MGSRSCWSTRRGRWKARPDHASPDHASPDHAGPDRGCGHGEPWPTDIRLDRAEKLLEIAFEDGSRFSLPAEYLRVESPSAEVQGHSPADRLTVPGCRTVGLLGVEPVGTYAIRLRFDDGHDTGIFTWRYLHQLGREREDAGGIIWPPWQPRVSAAIADALYRRL